MGYAKEQQVVFIAVVLVLDYVAGSVSCFELDAVVVELYIQSVVLLSVSVVQQLLA